MKPSYLVGLLLLGILIITGCSESEQLTPTPSRAIPTNTLPDPPVTTIKVPDAEKNADRFLHAWKNDAYEDMYAMISSSSKDAVSEEEFIQAYQGFAGEVALDELSYSIISSQIHPQQAFFDFNTQFSSFIFDDMTRSMSMELNLEDDVWRIVWDESLIMPELSGGNYIKRDSDIISRALIYDANQGLLASQAEAVAVGLRPDFLNLEESEGLLSYLTRISGEKVSTIIDKIENSAPGSYIPIGEVQSGEYENVINALSGYGSVVIGRYTSRYYPEGGIAPHLVGYVSAIQADEVDEFRRLGYQSFEKVGRDAIEEWGEPYLSGERGGILYLFDKEGNILSELDRVESGEGQDINTTIQSEFQQQVQTSIDGFRAAAVVLERDTGKVLAMASSPDFNPNGFQTENINWDSWLSDVYNDPNNPLFNRASQGQYPLGSVFKIITMAAGLESGLYDENTTYDCGYFFTEALGLELRDWTYEWFLEDGETQPSGLLTLPEGLIRSCNPFFWHIGLDLYEQGLTTAVSEMARGFGLGEPTGIIGVPEQPGNVSDPEEPVDAINTAIGQGEILVTPLQVARFVAALGNGGNLMTPWVVDEIVSSDGEAVFDIEPEISGTLPVSQENLQIIQDAMKGVVYSRDPRGTAEKALRDIRVPVAGKTGTAESGAVDPHAWFVGYSLAEWEDKPDIAVVVLVENVGEGSEYAAPIFRRIIEYYFLGVPQRLYPWEAAVGVTKTPTPLYTETPFVESEE